MYCITPLCVYHLQKKARHQYVRVGGGWMKIDHYRNHHVPLKIYEHRREAANNKFLSIKYRYTKDKKRTPVAWAKYRSRVAHESWGLLIRLASTSALGQIAKKWKTA